MWQTPFHIPHEFLGHPVLGAGWLLALWAVGSAVLLTAQVWRQGWNAETRGYLPMLLLLGAAIWLLLPKLEELADDGTPLGLPIRGYGVMLMVGVVAGVGLATRQARRVGIDPEVIFSLSFAIFVGGIVGARLFYVIEYWPQFFQGPPTAILWSILNVTQGGLVVYGSIFGGVAAGCWFLRQHRLPILALANLMTPGFLVGLAFGRIGCLLNGCCFGGLCEHGVTFPQDSPPYIHQRSLGEMHGFQLAQDPASGAAVVKSVTGGSPAQAAGLAAGDVIRSINGISLTSFQNACTFLKTAPPDLRIETDRSRVRVALDQYPARSLRVHPTQIYAALDAALLCFLLWAYYPFRRRDGEVFAGMLTIYPLVRILEEKLRTDEPGQFSTRLTISQWISLLLLVAIAGFWVYLIRQPRGSLLAARSETAASKPRQS